MKWDGGVLAERADLPPPTQVRDTGGGDRMPPTVPSPAVRSRPWWRASQTLCHASYMRSRHVCGAPRHVAEIMPESESLRGVPMWAIAPRPMSSVFQSCPARSDRSFDRPTPSPKSHAPRQVASPKSHMTLHAPILWAHTISVARGAHDCTNLQNPG